MSFQLSGHRRLTRKECVKMNQYRTSNKTIFKAEFDFNQPHLKFGTSIPWAIPDADFKRFVSDHPHAIMKTYPILREELTIKNYQEKFKTLLWIEEIEREIQFRQYDMEPAILTWNSDHTFFIPVPGLADGRPSLIVGDKVHLVPGNEEIILEGIIIHIDQNQIKVVFPKELFCDIFQSYDTIQLNGCEVKFLESRGALRFHHWALSWVANDEKLFSSVLFPTYNSFKSPLLDVTISEINFISNQLNRRQKNAVVNILRSECRPSPYVLYGPPGTGKTVTLVECILQVFLHFKYAKILVCGVSNTCADTIACKLIESKLITKGSMVRILAHSRVGKIPKELREFSTIFGEEEIDDLLYRYQIIISTCASVGRIARVAKDWDFQFTHTFIDEAAQAIEPEILLPICLSAQNEEYGCTVIAGDPKQLGPFVTSSNVFGKNDLNLTLMERLLDMKRYTKHEYDYKEFGFYDPRVLTKLVCSYRCCMELIKVNNELFYDNELNCHPPKDIELMAKMNLQFPIQFIASRGSDEQTESSPSWFNKTEAKICVKKLRQLFDIGLLENEIGIITPYHGQCVEIKHEIEKVGLKKSCKIATIQEFQGGERRVIILSMVRSNEKNLAHDTKFRLGFIFNNKRFNVATSRAKSLLIVIGNPDILKLDDTWEKFITYVCKNHETKSKFDRNWLWQRKITQIPETKYDVENRIKTSFLNNTTSPKVSISPSGFNKAKPVFKGFAKIRSSPTQKLSEKHQKSSSGVNTAKPVCKSFISQNQNTSFVKYPGDNITYDIYDLLWITIGLFCIFVIVLLMNNVTGIWLC